MEDNQDHNNQANHVSTERSSHQEQQPVRSRWTPKPEQILILESIFNSGMVNPPKDETVRIRKLLEKFGSVGDANVFYWFQNRRSRSRRRQRQLQAASAAAATQQLGLDQNSSQQGGSSSQTISPGGGRSGSSSLLMGFGNCNTADYVVNSPSNSFVVGSSSSSSSCGGLGDHQDSVVHENLFLNNHFVLQEMEESSSAAGFSTINSYPSESSSLHYQSGFGMITVFINGVATEVPRGAVNVRAMFGEDVILIHSSGLPLPTNDLGFLMQSLQHGESYFLVSKPT